LDPLRDLAKSIQRITEIVETGDEEAFVRLMQRGREYLSDNS
jgi:prephenate dehydrogenase